MAYNATTFLEQKVFETIGEYGVPALAAAVVTSQGADNAWAQWGIRKVGGASDYSNLIVRIDKFNLGSISKVVTGFLMTKLIQEKVGGLTWDTTILDVFPDLPTDAADWQQEYGPQLVTVQPDGTTTAAKLVWQKYYGQATMPYLLSHSAGFPYSPSTDVDLEWMNYMDQSTMNTDSLMARRYLYVEHAVVDPPLYGAEGLGPGFVYDGGAIICAAMAERLTGKTYEQLMHEYVFGPLDMVNSGFGRLYRGYPDYQWWHEEDPIQGPWQHRWDDADRRFWPDGYRMRPGYNWDPRAPVGDVAMSAEDMALFLQEQVSDKPKVCTVDARSAAQTTVKTVTFVQGGWGGTVGPVTQIWHDGENGVSYARAVVQLDSGKPKAAYAAMSNVATLLARPAIDEMSAVSQFMLDDKNKWLWNKTAPKYFLPCDHPGPALTIAADFWGHSSDPQDPVLVQYPGKRMVFARKYDGSVWYSTSDDGGAHWWAAGALPDTVSPNVQSPAGLEDASSPVDASSTVAGALPEDLINSGLAACISATGDRCYLFGRKTASGIWFRRSTDAGATWERWRAIPNGLFRTGPAAAASADGRIVHVVGVGLNQRLYWSRSVDGGTTWSSWEKINYLYGGEGPFTSALALACSDDGQTLHVFGRGDNWRIWYVHSTNGGTNWWQADWVADWELSDQGTIAQVPTSSPAAATSSDGTAVVVVVRGSNRGMWFNSMDHTDPESGRANWKQFWQPIGSRTFTSAPAMAMNDPGDGGVSLVALDDNFTLWGSRYHPTPDGVPKWDDWSALQGVMDDFA
jgi:CubicO group peptidase (beta-lactamase class C family)